MRQAEIRKHLEDNGFHVVRDDGPHIIWRDDYGNQYPTTRGGLVGRAEYNFEADVKRMVRQRHPEGFRMEQKKTDFSRPVPANWAAHRNRGEQERVETQSVCSCGDQDPAEDHTEEGGPNERCLEADLREEA
jgi:hypothetical protein